MPPQEKKKSKKSKKEKKDKEKEKEKDRREHKEHKEHKDRHDSASAGNGGGTASGRSTRDSGSSSKHRQHEDPPLKSSSQMASSRKQSIDSAEEDGEIVPGKGGGDGVYDEGPASKRQRVQSEHGDRDGDKGKDDMDRLPAGERNGELENGKNSAATRL